MWSIPLEEDRKEKRLHSNIIISNCISALLRAKGIWDFQRRLQPHTRLQSRALCSSSCHWAGWSSRCLKSIFNKYKKMNQKQETENPRWCSQLSSLHHFLFSLAQKDYNNANFCEGSSWQVEGKAYPTLVYGVIIELSVTHKKNIKIPWLAQLFKHKISAEILKNTKNQIYQKVVNILVRQDLINM